MPLKSSVIVLLLAVFFPAGVSWARTNDMKAPCANCHTMHSSQNGAEGTPQGSLLRNTCDGCHTGDNVTGGMPMVMSASANYSTTGTEATLRDTLAGGNFRWVAGGEPLKGHDVDGFGITQAHRQPPGGSTWFGSPDPLLTCAGTNGCHGDLSKSNVTIAMYQTHHAAVTAQPMDGLTLLKSYRLLNGTTGYIAGFEDDDYEFTVSTALHNQYKGVARGADTDSDATTISHSCARCHGNFHYGPGDAGIAGTTFASPWLRHPVDYAMGLTGEYGGYGGAGNAYDIVVPLGSTDVSDRNNVVSGAGDAIIVCVTCHRAHGSPYDYSLRWNYAQWPVGGYDGCGHCHTAKN